MSELKIKFSNWWVDNVNPNEFGPIFFDNPYLKANGIKLIESNEPDIIIYGTYYDFISSACSDGKSAIKVLFITEPISPDFILFDYCIGFEPLSFGDRYCYYPDFVYSPGTDIKNVSFDEAKGILKKKELFCDFIYSHDGIDVSRKRYFDLLNSYKRVESAGTYLNNQQNDAVVDFRDNGDTSKYKLQEKCKFSLCVQSIDKDWFINEKIMHVIKANSIPIFWGTEKIKEIVNHERVIFINDYKNDEELLNRVKEIDNNDELYCKIISTPLFKDQGFQDKTIDNACRFFYKICCSRKKYLLDYGKEFEIKNRLLTHRKAFNFYQKKKKSLFRRTPLKILRFFQHKKENEAT